MQSTKRWFNSLQAFVLCWLHNPCHFSLVSHLVVFMDLQCVGQRKLFLCYDAGVRNGSGSSKKFYPHLLFTVLRYTDVFVDECAIRAGKVRLSPQARHEF